MADPVSKNDPVRSTRDVHLSPTRVYSFGDYQMNYLDYRTRRLIPSTRIFQEGELYYSTNSLGCVGPELEAGLPVVAFFGDSCTHGYRGRAFAEQVEIEGCQPLNAGVEGLLLPWIVDRFVELRDKVPMVCAAVHSGWHNIAYNERTEAYWAAQLDRIAGVPLVAHFRLVADINEDAIDQSYEQVLSSGLDYRPWMGFDYRSAIGRRDFADEIARFNRFIEGYCRDRGRLLIDLAPATAPLAYGDLGRAFLDFIHPSPVAYPTIAAAIRQQLSSAVAAVLAGGDGQPGA